ncbi:MAG: BrnT family toxin [Pseudomonadota bacterium]
MDDDYEWDADKAEGNLARHGVPFDAVRRFRWAGRVEGEDRRYDYGEARFVAFGLIGDRVHTLVYTLRENGNVRVISLRKANAREVRRYVERKSTEAP